MSERVRSDNMAVLDPEPAWDIARIFPRQGTCSEEEYLALETNRLVECSHGHIEKLPMPTQSHQWEGFSVPVDEVWAAAEQ